MISSSKDKGVNNLARCQKRRISQGLNESLNVRSELYYHCTEVILFLVCSPQDCGPLDSEAMVMGVLDQSFDVLVLRYGVQKRIYCKVSSITLNLRGAVLFSLD